MTTTMSNNNGTLLLEVQGLCCSEEKTLLEKKIGALSGVHRYDVNVVSQRLHVEYDPSHLSPQDIIKSVAETGMKALAADGDGDARFAWWQEPRILMLIVCGVLSTVALIGTQLGLPALISRILYLLAIAAGGFYPAKSGMSAARTMTMNINTLLILGVVGAVGLDLWDEAAILVFVYSLGHVLETFVVKKSRGAIKSFVDLAPKEALVKRGDRETILPAADLRIGDIVIVKPGEKIPIDGSIIDGTSYVDESTVTGEPVPVRRRINDPVFAGTMNQKGSLTVRVTKTSQDTTLAKIIHTVEQVQAKKSTYQRFGEKFSRIYTPLMFFLGIAVAVLPPLFTGAEWQEWIYRALVVFVVSCSCGLALSVPVAIVAAVGNAARHGILTKGGLYLEKTAKVSIVAFDKTGTLTIGRPMVGDVLPAADCPVETLLSIGAAIEARSEHPLGEAIVRKAKETGCYTQRNVTDFAAVPGRGVRARIDGEDYLLGNAEFFEENGVAIDRVRDTLHRLEADARSAVIIGNRRQPLGIFAISDTIKQESKEAVRQLRDMGLEVVMLTGDTAGTSSAIARTLGIDDVRSGLLPQDKIEAITALGGRSGSVMMVGDGINDSPAMAASDVGVAMGAAGTDVAMETGDVVLLADDLSRVPHFVRLSRRTMTNVQQNVFLSLAVIALLVPAALVGAIDLLSGLLINEGGALLVILNGLRLLK